MSANSNGIDIPGIEPRDNENVTKFVVPRTSCKPDGPITLKASSDYGDEFMPEIRYVNDELVIPPDSNKNLELFGITRNFPNRTNPVLMESDAYPSSIIDSYIKTDQLSSAPVKASDFIGDLQKIYNTSTKDAVAMVNDVLNKGEADVVRMSQMDKHFGADIGDYIESGKCIRPVKEVTEFDSLRYENVYDQKPNTSTLTIDKSPANQNTDRRFMNFGGEVTSVTFNPILAAMFLATLGYLLYDKFHPARKVQRSHAYGMEARSNAAQKEPGRERGERELQMA